MDRHLVIGTAGHVDHGKTSLVLALTGIDTDRLLEEKRRGITIENGFASLSWPDGLTAGIIDVPGHEKFVRHMLAGSGGIDVALLVVAADDGIMPQTREHLDILKLLNVKSLVVALSKCDLAPDEEWVQLITEDILSLTHGLFSQDPKIIPVSVQTGVGLDILKNSLKETLLQTSPQIPGPNFRLPLDRIFTMPGFGTVVTGTLLDGEVSTGEQIIIYPREIAGRIRQIQVHSQTVEKAFPGQRVAINLPNIKKQQLSRGDILAKPGSLKSSFMLDGQVSVLPNSPFTLKNGRLIQLHLLAREMRAKAVLMNCDELAAGESDYVQLRLTEPAVARRGDRFVIRLPSPAITVGGGEILDPFPQKHRRRKPEVLKQFATKESGSLRQRVELAVRERPGTFGTLDDLILRADLGPLAKEQAHILAQKGQITALTKDIFIHNTEIMALTLKLKNLLSHYHSQNPHSLGLSQEEIRTRLAPLAPQAAWDGLARLWLKDKLAVLEEGLMRLSTFQPQADAAKNAYLELLTLYYLSFKYSPPATSAVLPAKTPGETRQRRFALAELVRQNVLVYLDDLYHIHSQYYESSFLIFKDLSLHGPVEPGPFRDALGTSRKIAVALLESFEKRGRAVKKDQGRMPV
jgi:selenocysteine-specific elongation factor